MLTEPVPSIIPPVQFITFVTVSADGPLTVPLVSDMFCALTGPAMVRLPPLTSMTPAPVTCVPVIST